MRCLVVGGTGFLGGAIVDRLVADGHKVDVLSRGQTKRETPAAVSIIQANRYADLSAIYDKAYDWIFDTCAFSPDAVQSLLDAVGVIQRYVFISSLSAYDKFEFGGVNEKLPVQAATDEELATARGLPQTQKGSAASYAAAYGRLKRSSEIKAQEMLGDRATSLRVGLLVGEGDYSDRLGYWVRRFDQATNDRKSVAVPNADNRLVQLIDVKDIADFALACAQNKIGGILNVTSPPLSFEMVINEIITATNTKPDIVWASHDQITNAEVAYWSELPMVVPPNPELKHFFEVDTTKAKNAGLRCRPISETLVPLLEWDRTRREVGLKSGLTPEKERRLLVV